MERSMSNFGLADFFVAKNRKRASFLDGVLDMLDWVRIEKLLKTGLGRTQNPCAGAKAYPALLMFKVLLLQQWYDLSDQDTEFALLDRISFSRFTGLSLNDSVPDHTTICRFRNLLVEKDLLEILLHEINKQMEQKGKLVKRGVAVDASLVASAARPRKLIETTAVTCDRKEEDLSEESSEQVRVTYSHDTDAAWLKKGNQCHYGYKIHTAVDVDTGLILSAHATAANLSDTGELGRLVKEARLADHARVYGDKGYTSSANSSLLKERRCKDGIMKKAYRNKPLSERQRQRNRLISQKRYIVERVFGTLKKSYNLVRASYIGTLKVQGELLLSALAYNLKRSLFLVPA